MSKQPKPTGEWTVDDNGDIITIQTEEMMRGFVFPAGTSKRLPEAIVKRHNAALAAVCKVSQDSQRALWEATKQLAAERELTKPATAEWTVEYLEYSFDIGGFALLASHHNDIERKLRADLDIERDYGNRMTVQLEEAQLQVAGEREKIENLHGILGKKRTEIRQLKDKLARVREGK